MMENKIIGRRKRVWASVALLLNICFYPLQSCFAENELAGEHKNRMEISASYENLSPNSYGNWNTFSADFYRKESPELTWHAQFSNFSRPDGKAQLFGAGAYKDWTDRFYTYTSVSAGTSSSYLPRLRVDNDFNYKLGRTKNLVGTIGGTYIQYHGDHKDYILSTGLTAYMNKTVAEYRIFRNQSEPGSVNSYSHLVSLGYGQEKKQRTTVTYSFGKQAYLATALATPEEVRNNSKLITLKHRRWLKDDYGIFGEISRFNLENSYHKTGFLVGFFREY